MLEFEVEHEYDFSAEKVWAVAGDFGGLKAWMPGVLACRVEGSGAADKGGDAVRIVDVFDGSVTIERLNSLDDQTMTYGYSILEAKGFDPSCEYHAVFRVVPLEGGRSKACWGARFTLPASIPPEKGEKAKGKAAQLYSLCLMNLQSVLAAG